MYSLYSHLFFQNDFNICILRCNSTYVVYSNKVLLDINTFLLHMSLSTMYVYVSKFWKKMCYLEWNLDGNITLFIVHFCSCVFLFSYLAIREPMYCKHIINQDFKTCESCCMFSDIIKSKQVLKKYFTMFSS